jgi:hypothetical protein
MKVYRLTEIDYDAPKKVCKRLPFTIDISEEHLKDILKDIEEDGLYLNVEDYLEEEGANIISDITCWAVNDWKLVVTEESDSE